MEKVDRIEAFRIRTKNFALAVIKLFQLLPHTTEAQIIGKQLLRSATSVAANYRAACRARSPAERYSKICIVMEEADESLFWMEILTGAQISSHQSITILKNEAEEIVKIINATRQKLKPH